MNKLKHFLLNSKNINKSSFIWNMAGSMLMAFQSVIMLMIITRTLNLYEAGVFTLAYASANLFLNIGKYGMRNFQVSDVKRQFNFKEYNTSRIITTLLMLIVSLVYVVIAKSKNDYNMNKTWIIIWMCLFKIVDSIEDTYLGYYQQENRLDVAGKILTLRMILTILVFGLGLIFLRDQLISLMIATIFTTLLLIMFVTLTYPAFRKEESVHKGKVWELLRVCFPLRRNAGMLWLYSHASICDWIAEQLYIQSDDCKDVYDVERTTKQRLLSIILDTDFNHWHYYYCLRGGSFRSWSTGIIHAI